MTKQFSTPGPRAIHPELCDSPSMGRCGLLANLLFPRLVAQADDQGRLAGGAAGVLVQCLPRLLRLVSVDQVGEALDELAEAGMLERYEHRGDELIQLTRWWHWQAGQRRAFPSRWPAPRGWQDLVYGNAQGEAASFEQAVDASSPRNAAIRGVPRRNAASRAGPRTGPDAGARVGASAGGVPPRAPTDAVPSGASAPAREGAGGPRGGAMERFSDLVPPPPGHR